MEVWLLEVVRFRQEEDTCESETYRCDLAKWLDFYR